MKWGGHSGGWGAVLGYKAASHVWSGRPISSLRAGPEIGNSIISSSPRITGVTVGPVGRGLSGSAKQNKTK